MAYIRDEQLLILFGSKIQILRKEKKLSMRNLAYKADIELSQIYRIEKGISNPSLSTISALSKALDVPIIELFKF